MRQFSLWFGVYIYLPAKTQHVVNKNTKKDVLNRVPTFKTTLLKEKVFLVLQHVDDIHLTEVCVLPSGDLPYSTLNLQSWTQCFSGVYFSSRSQMIIISIIDSIIVLSFKK